MIIGRKSILFYVFYYMLSSGVREEIRGRFPNPNQLHHDVWSLINYTVGKVLHLCFSKLDKSLNATGKGYLKTTGSKVTFGNLFFEHIEALVKTKSGLIILNHPANNFTDTLPLLSGIPDEILSKTTFYTVSETFNMNTSEFPLYKFVRATLRDRSDVEELTKNIQQDIDSINNGEGYIFIIPSGGGDCNARFKAIFQRFIKGISEDVLVLSNNVSHESIHGYFDIGMSMIKKKGTKTLVKSFLNRVSDWKGKTGEEMREYYNSMFS